MVSHCGVVGKNGGFDSLILHMKPTGCHNSLRTLSAPLKVTAVRKGQIIVSHFESPQSEYNLSGSLGESIVNYHISTLHRMKG